MSALHRTTAMEVLREHARSRPDRTAVVCGDTRLSYHQLARRVEEVAAGLAAAGLGAGDRLLWLGQNCHRVLECLLAAAEIGAVFCPVNWRQSPAELAFVLDDADPAVVVWQEEEVGPAVRAARSLASSTAVWARHDTDDPAVDGEATYEALVRAARAPAGAADPGAEPVDPAASLLMMYTAAFAGHPNGALLSHTAVLTGAALLAPVQGVTSGSVYLNAGPLFHMATFMTTMSTFVMGGANVFTRRVEPEALCATIESERCTGAFLLPPTIEQIVERNAEGRFDLSSLRTMPGRPEWASMTTPDDSPWARQPGGYGQTEVMGFLTLRCLGPEPLGPHGYPLPLVQVRVVGPDGEDAAPGQPGELVARGPTMMNGYWNRPALTAERRAGGWHHTNDIGRREADGSITFIGPKTRLLKSAAENIYPAEVEACIKAHPAVRDAAVIGVPDPTWTQSVKAVVVLAEGCDASAADIIEHCRTSIASYKKPRTVEFVDELPRQGLAVDYAALDARFGGGGYPGDGR